MARSPAATRSRILTVSARRARIRRVPKRTRGTRARLISPPANSHLACSAQLPPMRPPHAGRPREPPARLPAPALPGRIGMGVMTLDAGITDHHIGDGHAYPSLTADLAQFVHDTIPIPIESRDRGQREGIEGACASLGKGIRAVEIEPGAARHRAPGRSSRRARRAQTFVSEGERRSPGSPPSRGISRVARSSRDRRRARHALQS